MRVKILSLRYTPTLGGFDDGPLVEFTRDKEVLAFREHFHALSDVPHLFCVILYQEPVLDPATLADARALRKEAADRGEMNSARRISQAPADLDERDRLLWSALREWRAQKAREEGVPAYVILRDRHITAIVVSKPDSPTALGNIPGIGPAKVKSYGGSILAILHGRAQPSEPRSNGTSPSGEEAPWES